MTEPKVTKQEILNASSQITRTSMWSLLSPQMV